jgi:hypothetical protein
MTFEERKSVYEQDAKSLVGKRIRRVHYYEVDYGEDQYGELFKGWRIDDRPFHALDFGIEFTFKSDELFSLIWGSEFASYGLSIVHDSLQTELRTFAVWDVTHESAWLPFLNIAIQDVKVYWGWWQESETPEIRRHLPVVWHIGFEGKQELFIGAYCYLASKNLFPSCDELIVTFDAETAKKYFSEYANEMK